MSKKTIPTVAVVPPISDGRDPTIVLKFHLEEVRLTGLQAVILAGDLFEGTGRIVQHLDQRQQSEIARVLQKISVHFQ